jgi:alpha-tubulin suppressor-like RCC1 family protein
MARRPLREAIKIPATPLGLDGASTHVVQLRAGDHHTCAVTDTGDALCWGESHHGQAGSGVFGVGLPPKVVAGL